MSEAMTEQTTEQAQGQLGLELEERVILMPERLGKTAITSWPAREILTKTSGFISSYDYTLNPYRGCSFGCSYCYAAFFTRDQKQQDTWGEWVSVKDNAGALIAGIAPGALNGRSIYMSSVTDPYQPIEKRAEVTREALENLADRHAPRLVVQTRSPLVVRDTDLFGQIAARGGRVQVNMTVTTDDDEVRRAFEPGCPTNAARLKAVAALEQAGVQTCVTMTPLLTVRDVDAFAASLLATGCRRFISQPFHFERGEFVAQTREVAFQAMADRLGCGRDEFQAPYLEHYRQVRDRLRELLPQLGEGRDGFRPPF